MCVELTEKALKEFEVLWLEDNPGQILPREKLVAMASRVLRAFELAYRPIPKEKEPIFKKIGEDQERRENEHRG